MVYNFTRLFVLSPTLCLRKATRPRSLTIPLPLTTPPLQPLSQSDLNRADSAKKKQISLKHIYLRTKLCHQLLLPPRHLCQTPGDYQVNLCCLLGVIRSFRVV